MITGTALSAAANLGTYVVSKGRTERYLKKANAEFFALRMLKVSLCSTKAMAAIAGTHTSEKTLAPLEESEKDSVGVQERRLAAIKDYAADLTLDVLPLQEQTTLLAKMSAWQAKRDLKTHDKRLVKGRRSRTRSEQRSLNTQRADFRSGWPDWRRRSSKSWDSGIERRNEDLKMLKADKNADKELRKLERE